MNKSIIVLAIVLSIVATAYGACDASSVTSCSNTYSDCVTDSNGNADEICTCYGSLFSCLGNAGCPVDSYKSACTAAGCTEAQCSAPANNNAGVISFSVFAIFSAIAALF